MSEFHLGGSCKDRETHEMMDKVVTNADGPSLSYKLNKLALALIFQ